MAAATAPAATNQIPKVEVQGRAKLGTRDAGKLRKTGRIPVVVYGHGQEPAHMSVDRKTVTDLINHQAHLMEIAEGDHTQPVLIKDVQWDHMGSTIVHLDLARIDLTEKVTVEVPLEFVGENAALKSGGTTFVHPVSEIEIECLATQIPHSIKVDISALKIDDHITVGDLKLPEGVTTTLDADTIVASIQEVLEEEAAAGEPGVAEPEVIGKKAEDEAAADEKKK